MKALLDLCPGSGLSENLFDHPFALVHAPQNFLHKNEKNIAKVWQGTLALMILKTLETMGPQHGYGIARRIEQTSGRHHRSAISLAIHCKRINISAKRSWDVVVNLPVRFNLDSCAPWRRFSYLL
jgi:hypothetical protein